MKPHHVAQLLLAVLLIGGAWSLYLEPASVGTREHDVVLDGWPESLDGLKVAVLADLHVGSPYYGLDKLEEVVALTNAQSPDLVLLAGDYVIQGVFGGEFVAPEDFAPVLGKLEARWGVYAVLGNHDHWLNARRVEWALEEAGIPVLENESVGRGELWVAGLSDLWSSYPDVDRALSSVPAGAPVLAFTHNPDLFPEIPERVSLTLAGHTHGGQVKLPLFGTLVVPSQFGSRYARGHIVEGDRHLFVSSGLGTSIFPVRFRVPPEVSILRLRAGEPASSVTADR